MDGWEGSEGVLLGKRGWKEEGKKGARGWMGKRKGRLLGKKGWKDEGREQGEWMGRKEGKVGCEGSYRTSYPFFFIFSYLNALFKVS